MKIVRFQVVVSNHLIEIVENASNILLFNYFTNKFAC